MDMEQRKEEAMTLAQRIRKLLDASEMTQRELARRCRMSESCISRIVAGKRTEITVTSARRIAHGLGVTISDLLEEEN